MIDEARDTSPQEPSPSELPPKLRLPGSGKPNGLKPETKRIDLSAAEPPDSAPTGDEPLRVADVLKSVSPRTEVRMPSAVPPKSQTTRLSVSDSQPVQPGESVPVAKAATSRIPLSESQRLAAEKAGEVPKAIPTKRATSPIATEGVQAPAAAAAAAAQGALGRTARIIIDEEESLPTGGSLGDTGKMTIPPAAVPPAPGTPPKTVRLQRPAAGPAPKTIVLKRPEGAPGAAPKTVVLKPPSPSAPAEPAVSPPSAGPATVETPSPAATLEAKGATARISIPASALDAAAPTTQRKTIRIKRSEAPVSSARTVVLARPPVTAAPKTEGAPVPTIEPKAELEAALGVPTAEPGLGYAIVAILTFLVMGALLYVLLAQTYFPQWALPGRLS
ncbi:MAG: hypothetical protein N2652_02555 [Kiritimatiellae bacterium]|nr:hypothetical protein [Kiritimatiellia bacterium]